MIPQPPVPFDLSHPVGQVLVAVLFLIPGLNATCLFGPNSNASFYPEDQDQYLQQAWRLDDQGRFVQPVQDTQGVLLGRDVIEVLESLVIRTREDEGVEGR